MFLRQLDKEYNIHVYETGPDGRVSLYSLINYMQDIASDHAVMLGFGRDDLMKKNHFWVLSRMYAEITRWPSWGDKIVIRTWPNGTDKLFAMRNYEIKFPDGRMIASAVSSWLIIDRTTKKIQRPDWLLTQYNDSNLIITTSARNPEKLHESAESGNASAPFRVKVSDLDVNLHTNNAIYIKWAYDTYDLNFTMNRLPCSAEINYLAESIFDDEIIIRSSIDEGDKNIVNHSVVRISDNRELCRMRLTWKEPA
ncbi:MAG: acyl-ACP thioesterase domain-containing protein [Bacteroidales bacterium]